MAGSVRAAPASRARLLAVAAAFLSLVASADGDGIAGRGEPANLAPLSAVLERVRAEFPGRVLKAELERDGKGGGWTFEVKVLTEDGRVLEVEVDATSLELLGVEGRRRRRGDDD